jgi:hypothetical protein
MWFDVKEGEASIFLAPKRFYVVVADPDGQAIPGGECGEINARAVDLELKAAQTRAAARRLWLSATPSEPVRARSGDVFEPLAATACPRTTAWIRTVTETLARPALAGACASPPGSSSEAQLAFGSPTSARSKVMSSAPGR